MSHRIAATAVAVLATVGISSAATAAPSEFQDGRPCVTQEEFWDIHPGMTRMQVQAVLDGPGRTFDEGTDERFLERRYPVCELPFHQSRVLVIYKRDTDRMSDAFKVRYHY